MRKGSGLKPDGVYESGGAVKEKMNYGVSGSPDNCFNSFRAFGSMWE